MIPTYYSLWTVLSGHLRMAALKLMGNYNEILLDKF